jgi:GR25 family glycosyltransferase involved in LPS biosynthesis/glycosyltransferase involved in cell wall biosynthesis
MNVVFHVGYYATHWNATAGIPGGTEQCIVNLSKQLGLLGHAVYIYGDVLEEEIKFSSGSVSFLALGSKAKLPERIDFLVGVSYLHYLKYFPKQKVGSRIFWLHNEEPFFWFEGKKMSDADIEYAFENTDLFVCLTDWHKSDFQKRHPKTIGKIKVIGNGIDEQKIHKPTQKEKNSYVYTSHAERGLSTVLDDLESGKISGHLHICTPLYGIKYFNDHFLERISGKSNVTYHGALPTEQLYFLLSKMENWYYPTTYNETYCITAIEMLAHEVKPIVNAVAGLSDTLKEFANDTSCLECVKKYVETRWWSNVSKEWVSLFSESTLEKRPNKIIDLPIDWYQNMTLIKTNYQAPNYDVDKVYIICLNPTDEKKSELIERFNSSGIKAKEVVVFEATNGYTNRFMPAGTKAWPGWKINSDNSWWNRDILPGEIGCAASHWRIWKDAQSHRHSKILILEEDFTIIRPFNREAVNTSEEWTIMYLGHSFVNQPVRTVTANLVQPGYTYTTHAYMLTDEGCRLLLEQNYLWSIIPLDEFLSATFCDHPRKDLSWIWRDSKALAVVPSFFGQSSTKDTSTTENQPILSKMNLNNYSYEEFVKRFVTYSAKTKEWELIVDEPINDVFIFPLFTEEFCRLLIEQAEESQKWTKNRHYFYPTCDMLINELGLQSHYQRILEEFVYPVAIKKWALEGNDWPAMSSENFIIKYDESVQGHLALHHDSAAISMVLALNDDYEGGGTYFWKQKELHKGKTGYISIHPSIITHRHGARAVTKGKRFVLVSFCNRTKK